MNFQGGYYSNCTLLFKIFYYNVTQLTEICEANQREMFGMNLLIYF